LLIAERFSPDIGGVARSAGRIAAAIARLGVSVDVLAWTKTIAPGELVSEQSRQTPASGLVTVHRLGLFGSLDFSLQHSMNVLEWLYEQQRFDAVWGHYLFPAGFMATLFAEMVQIPSTVSVRGNDVDRLMFPPGDFARLLWTLQRSSVRTAVSRDLAKKVDVLLGHDAETLVIGNAVDLETFTPREGDAELRMRLGIGADEAVLGFCGELRQKKGLPHLLRALRTVRTDRPACLLVIGDVRVRERALLSEFSADCPEDAARIIITGQVHEPVDVARHLALCDLLLLPSLWDGLPNALLEAQAAGVPVLASDAGGIPEAIEHGQTGFLVPRSQLHRLGEAALEVLNMPVEQRAEVVAAARKSVATKFNDIAEAAALTEVLRRLRG
jgi:glycosyltransferase involved in cell wall biosynthesis